MTKTERQQIEQLARTGIPGYDPWATAGKGDYFDHDAGAKAARFFAQRLTHQKTSEFAGKPLVLEPWQLAIVYNLFGWKRDGGMRRYRKVYITTARKSGKTTLCAGLAVLTFMVDGEIGAEVYCAAAERKQAGILFDLAGGMMRDNPELARHVTLLRRRITLDATNSFLEAISSEAKSKHGYNAHAVFVDELHVIPNRDLVDALSTSFGSRSEPLIVYLTTAGWDRSSICWEKYTYAKDVRNGVVSNREFLPVIYELEEADDWQDETLWIKANPNMGVSMRIEDLRVECELAMQVPGYQNTFRRLFCNQWTSQAECWLPMDKWDTLCGGAIDESELEGRRCFAGVDMSSTTDLTTVCLLFPPDDDDDPHQAIWRCFVPAGNQAMKSRSELGSYREWVATGHLTATPGDVVDHSRIRAEIVALGERFDIAEIAIDRWDSTHLQTDLMGDGFEVIKFGQGFASMKSPCHTLETMVLSGQLRHGDNPVARWAANNVAVDIDPAGCQKPTKARSSGRIDPIVALLMAIGRADLDEGGCSVYETRGLTTL